MRVIISDRALAQSAMNWAINARLVTHMINYAVKGLADLKFGSGFEEFGCRVNAIDIGELFTRYRTYGFLYRAKLERLAPFMSQIVANWEKSIALGPLESPHRIITYCDERTGAWATVSLWWTTSQSVQCQHLVSAGRPEGSRAVMLSTQSELSGGEEVLASQNWFRAENRYPARIFGSGLNKLGKSVVSLTSHAYISVDPRRLIDSGSTIEVERCKSRDAPDVKKLASALCGPVQTKADQWIAEDFELDNLDERYKSCGLRRYRRVFVAHAQGTDQPLGLAVAYRGPLGLSFSFLENRLELWLDATLSNQLRLEVAVALTQQAASVYDTFELPHLMVSTDAATAAVFGPMAIPVQQYERCVWLRECYAGWYEHINGFFARMIRAANKQVASATP